MHGHELPPHHMAARVSFGDKLLGCYIIFVNLCSHKACVVLYFLKCCVLSKYILPNLVHPLNSYFLIPLL